VPDCGAATSTGCEDDDTNTPPGPTCFTDVGSLGDGVWVKARFDLAPFLGRRIQTRWLFGSLAFFGLPTWLSYLETPTAPGAFDVDEKDDGWHIDDIKFTGLLNNQLNLIIDGGDDIVSGTDVLCGTNLISETLASGGDTQDIDVGDPCGTSGTKVVTGGAVLNSVGSQICPSVNASFCTVATAKINNQTNSIFGTPYPGAPFVVDGGQSSLNVCVNGSIQYEFTRCNTLAIGGACDAATGTIVQGFSSDSQVTAFPTTATRYRMRVKCSSQPGVTGCLGSTDAAVYPGLVDVNPVVLETLNVGTPEIESDSINIAVTCTVAGSGSSTACDAADALSFSFTKPSEKPRSNGFRLYRATEASLTSADSPHMDGTCLVVGGFGTAEAAGATVTQAESPNSSPANRTANVYVVVHRPVTEALLHAPAGSGRAVVTGTGTNAHTVRFILLPVSACP